MYRGHDEDLYELWTKGEEAGWGDLTKAAGATGAKGNPAIFFNSAAQTLIVPYRGTDDHVHSLFWSTGAVGHENLSDFARAPKAAGDPVGYYTPHNDAHQVTYRGIDGHIHELWWHGEQAARHTDLTVLARGLPSVSDPAVYCNVGTNTKHAVYRTADGHLHELWWFLTAPGGSGETDLTSEKLFENS